jgi:hypothetical protein
MTPRILTHNNPPRRSFGGFIRFLRSVINILLLLIGFIIAFYLAVALLAFFVVSIIKGNVIGIIGCIVIALIVIIVTYLVEAYKNY